MADEKVRPQVTPMGEHIAQLAGLLVGLALCAAGCAAAPRPAGEWVKTRESAEDFDRARQACEQQSLAEVNKETADSMAAKAGVGGFFTCMKDRGWTHVPKATPTSDRR